MNNALLFLLGLAVIYTISAASGPSDEVVAWVEYCEMVALHKTTGGESGWPDYKGSFEESCK